MTTEMLAHHHLSFAVKTRLDTSRYALILKLAFIDKIKPFLTTRAGLSATTRSFHASFSNLRLCTNKISSSFGLLIDKKPAFLFPSYAIWVSSNIILLQLDTVLFSLF